MKKVVGVFLTIILFSYFFLLKDSKKEEYKEAKNQNKITKIKREIASIKKIKVENKKEEKRTKEEDNLLKRYQALAGIEGSVSLEFKEEISYGPLNKKGIIYKVSIDRGNGNISSFNSLIDKKTGVVERTWNRTHFERKNAVKFNGEGHEFYSI